MMVGFWEITLIGLIALAVIFLIVIYKSGFVYIGGKP